MKWKQILLERRDWSAEFLGEAINNTTIDEQGKFQPVGISTGTLVMMEEFLQRTPSKLNQLKLTNQ